MTSGRNGRKQNASFPTKWGPEGAMTSPELAKELTELASVQGRFWTHWKAVPGQGTARDKGTSGEDRGAPRVL